MRQRFSKGDVLRVLGARSIALDISDLEKDEIVTVRDVARKTPRYCWIFLEGKRNVYSYDGSYAEDFFEKCEYGYDPNQQPYTEDDI